MPRRSPPKASKAHIQRVESILAGEWDARRELEGREPSQRRALARTMVQKYDDLEPPELPAELHDRIQSALVFWGVIAESPLGHGEFDASPRSGRFEVKGTDRESGYQTRLVVDAQSEDDARRKADARGVIVTGVLCI